MFPKLAEIKESMSGQFRFPSAASMQAVHRWQVPGRVRPGCAAQHPARTDWRTCTYWTI